MTEFDIGLGYNSKMGKMEKPSEVRLSCHRFFWTQNWVKLD